MKKTRIIVFMAIMLLCCGLLFGCSSNSIARSDRVFRPAPYSYEILGEIDRTLPPTSDGGLPRYPTLGGRMPDATVEEKEKIQAESNIMYDYDKIDEQGNLFKNGINLNKKLFKHSAADGQIGGALSADAKAVVKKIHIIPSSIGNNPTGLFAPAGEIVTITLSEEDAARGMRVDIGMGSARGGSVGIPTTREFSRMPNLRKSITLHDTVNYVGSPLGGPIYLLNEGESNATGRKLMPYDVTISGAVETPHYYLGYTSDAEWERLKNAPGTIFDLDIFGGVRMTMPASIVRNKSAENMRKVAEFWESACAISNKYNAGNWYSDHPVTQIYDTYIPAGAAVAFVGADFSCLPISWANGVMNYDSFILNGSWGDIHEFNHHHQGWGAENGGEVTNNVINITTYMLHTNIGAQRTEAGGLSGWNAHTSAYLTLKDALGRVGKETNTTISMYTNLLHAFGDEAMIETAQKTHARTNEVWYKEASKAMGYDLTYYLESLCGFNLSQEAKDEVSALKLPIFVPIANTYQAGRDALVKNESGYERHDVMMGKPFYIPFGKDKELDLDAYMLVPSDVDYEIKEVSPATIGKLTNNGEVGKYTYTPDKKAKKPGEVRVTVGLKFKNNPNVKIEDVTLILQFMQDYVGADGKIWANPGYSDISTAISEGLEGTEATEKIFSYAGADSKTSNVILMSQGKIVLPEGKYKFFIRGSEEVLLYTGADLKNLEVSAHITDKLKNYDRARENSYFDVQIKNNSPLYYKMYVRGALNGTDTFGRIGYEDYSQMQGAKPLVNGETTGAGATENVPIIDLPTSAALRTDALIDAPSRTDFHSEIKYAKEFKANGVILIPMTNFNVSSAPKMYGNSVPNNMIDGDFTTIAHSATNLKFPVEFLIDMKTSQNFNLINLFSREPSSSRGRVKDFEIFAADTLVGGFTSIYKGIAENTYKTTITFNPGIQAKYIKIVINSIHGENYICFSEIQFGNGIVNAAVAPSSAKDIIYKGKWTEQRFGQYLNGFGVISSGNASAEINFHGTDFMMFAATGAEFGVGKIRIDEGEWQEVNFFSETTKYNQPVYAAVNLSDGYHKVEIKSDKGNKINIDYFGITPTIVPQVKKISVVAWVFIGIGILIGCIAIGIGGFALGHWWRGKNSRHAKIEDINVALGEKTEEKATCSVAEIATETEATIPIKTQKTSKQDKSTAMVKTVEEEQKDIADVMTEHKISTKAMTIEQTTETKTMETSPIKTRKTEIKSATETKTAVASPIKTRKTTKTELTKNINDTAVESENETAPIAPKKTTKKTPPVKPIK